MLGLLSMIIRGRERADQESAGHGKIALANEHYWAPITSTCAREVVHMSARRLGHPARAGLFCRNFFLLPTPCVDHIQPIADRVEQNLEIIPWNFQFSTRHTRNLMGFIICKFSYVVIIVNLMGRNQVRWKVFRNHLQILFHPIRNRLYQDPRHARGGRNIFSRHRCRNLPEVLGHPPTPPPYPSERHDFTILAPKFKDIALKFKYVAPKFKFMAPRSNIWHKFKINESCTTKNLPL